MTSSDKSPRIAENIVICLDCSRSMFIKDYEPNRLKCSINALKTLIKRRCELDERSAFAIVKFSDTAKKVVNFTNYEDSLYEALDSITIGGISNLGDALRKSIKILVAELRKVGAKIPRILIISDGNYSSSAVDPLKMARIAQGLNIKIDSLRLGKANQLNILKRLSDLTKGYYYYNRDVQSLIESIRNLAESNIKTYGSKTELLMENPAFLRKIAANLLKVQDLTKDQKVRLEQLKGKINFKKCTICFSETNPVTKGSFYFTGRYCPNCKAPFHVHCLGLWSDSLKDSKFRESGTCRCPHCFYLLKIPTEIMQAHKLRIFSTTFAKKQISSQKSDPIPVRIANITDLGQEVFYNSCPICNLIFEEYQAVVRCENIECGALYHLECFQKLKNAQCKICGVKLQLK
ncbi:MAG: VWA domain-containing protein [Promethearchaeota archaeon]